MKNSAKHSARILNDRDFAVYLQLYGFPSSPRATGLAMIVLLGYAETYDEFIAMASAARRF
jgi:hypothetical protein